MEKIKSWIVVGLLALIAILVLPSAISGLIPNVFETIDVPSEGEAADVDFPVVVRVKGGMLEVATVKGNGSFPKSTDPQILNQSIRYCRERASWAAPYAITYRIRLGDNWTLRFYRGRLIARVPDLEPSLPIAFDSSKLVEGAKESCWFFPDQGTRERALRSISPQLERLAENPKTKAFARDAARQTVTEFLRSWTLRQTAYADVPPDARIVVFFPGE